jgi:hypothetical protein
MLIKNNAFKIVASKMNKSAKSTNYSNDVISFGFSAKAV